MREESLKLFAFGVLAMLATSVQSQTLQRVWPVPRSGTFWSMQLTNQPPMPCLPDFLPQSTPIYQLTNGVYVYDDRNVDYAVVNELMQAVSSAAFPFAPGSGSYGQGGTNVYFGPKYGSNDFYLSILLDTNMPGYVDLELHNAPATNYFQLLTNTSLDTPTTWHLSQWVPGDPSSNNVWFFPVPCSFTYNAPSNDFFRAVSGVAVVRVYTDAYSRILFEPPGTPNRGSFVINVLTPNPTGLSVVYNLTGSAVNGVNYASIPTTVFIPPTVLSTNIYIQATNDNKIDFDEQVVLSLVLTNGYLIDPGSWQATLTISDNLTNMIQAVITNLPVADLDYYSPSNSLIASAYYPDWNTGTNYFGRIWTYFTTNGGSVVTNVAITNWSRAGGVVASYETRLTVVKTNTSTGFRPGETFFAPQANGTIGWISTNGVNWSNNWLTVTAESNTFSGDIYVDQTGIWGGDLLVVSGSGTGIPNQNMNIWRVNTNKQVSLVASIPTDHLEGLVTLPNDPTKYGPWSGKLITANENVGLFFAVDTNGNYQTFNLDVNGEPIQPSAMKVIPANQNLYFSDPRSDGVLPPLVLKIPQQYFTNFTGDILVTRAGENGRDAALFIVHWDNARNTFVNSKIPYGGNFAPFYGEYIEHATFAPVDLPPIQLQ